MSSPKIDLYPSNRQKTFYPENCIPPMFFKNILLSLDSEPF